MTSCKLPVFDRYPFVTCVVIVVIIVDVFVVVDDDVYDDDDDDEELSYVYTMCFLFKTHRPCCHQCEL